MIFQSVDSETFLFRNGLRAPRSVCWSYYCMETGEGLLLDRMEGLAKKLQLLRDPRVVLEGHNISYDLAVWLGEIERLAPARFRQAAELVLQALDQGRIYCTKITEQLLDIREGTFTTKEKGRYTLEKLVKKYLHLDVSEAKGKGIFKDQDFLAELSNYQYAWAEEVETGVPTSHSTLRQQLEQRYKIRYLDIPVRFRYADYAFTPVEQWDAEARRYSLGDTQEDGEIAFKQRQAFQNYKYFDPEFPWQAVNAIAQTKADFSFFLKTCWGFHSDSATIQSLLVPLEKKMNQLNTSLEGVGFVRREAARDGSISWHVEDKVVREAVRIAYKNNPPLTTETRDRKSEKEFVPQPKKDGETLEQSGNVNLVHLAERDDYTKILSSWIPTLIQASGSTPVHPSFGLLETGRRAASGPNIQQQPRGGVQVCPDCDIVGRPEHKKVCPQCKIEFEYVTIRECWTARKGFVFCSCDYNSIELKALAQICLWLFGHSKLAETFWQGRDPHCVTGLYLYNLTEGAKGSISYEQFMLQLEAEKKFFQGAKRICSDLRQLAKALNFGLPGGLGAARFVTYAKNTYNLILVEKQPGVMDLEASIQKANWLIEVWRSLYPEIEQYQKWVSRLCGGYGKKFTMEAFVSKRLRGNTGFTDGCNGGFQQLAAEGYMQADTEITRECLTGRTKNGRPSPLLHCHGDAGIHDEWFGELVDDSWLTERAMRVSQVMEIEMQQIIPDIPITAEAAIARRWYKEMKPVWKDNKLVPWEPARKTRTSVFSAA